MHTTRMSANCRGNTYLGSVLHLRRRSLHGCRTQTNLSQEVMLNCWKKTVISMKLPPAEMRAGFVNAASDMPMLVLLVMLPLK